MAGIILFYFEIQPYVIICDIVCEKYWQRIIRLLCEGRLSKMLIPVV